MADQDRIDRQSAFSGTAEVAAAMRFDTPRLQRHLETELPEFRGPLSVRQFRGGQSNPTYLLETPERRYVLRRKPPGPLLPSAHAIDREYRVIGALHVSGFPVAAPLLYCGDPAIIGTAFYLMDFAQGRVVWDPALPDADPAERRAIYDDMNAVMARLHNFDPAELGLSDFGRGDNYVARQVGRWAKQYRASETATIAAMDRLIEWLPDHLPPAIPPRLVHGDFRLDNVILSDREPKIVAVIDWELSTLGDPLADFTYSLMAWGMPRSALGADTGSLLGCDLKALGIPQLSDYVAAYAKRTGLDPRPHLPLYLCYNFFRLAAILQGIAGRVRDGTATNRNASAMAQMVAPLAAKAWDFAREAGA